MCDLKAVCSIKRKNGAFPIPEVPEQGDFLVRFPKSGMRGSEEAVWAMSSFFLLQTSSQSSSYRLLALLVPKTVSPPRGLSRFLCPGLFCPGEFRRPSPEARSSEPRTLRPSGGIRPLGPSEHERLSHPATERSVVQVTEEIAPLLWRLPPVNFPKSSQ